MKYTILFIAVLAMLYSANGQNSIKDFLSLGQYYNYQGMSDSFNVSVPKLDSKINGSVPYTIFAVEDPPLPPNPTFTSAQLNYHLLPGLVTFSSLPAVEGTLKTDSNGGNDYLRITLFNGSYWINGYTQISSAFPDYFDTTTSPSCKNCVFYTLKYSSAHTNLYPYANATTRQSIGQSIATLPLPSTIVGNIWNTASLDFTVPTPGWTLFVPTDSAFVDVPMYRLNFITNIQANAKRFLSAHSFGQTVFAEPFKQKYLNLGFSQTYTDLTTRSLDFKYANVQPDGPTWYLYDGPQVYANVLVKDQQRTDGVIHSIDKFLLPADWVWPLPSPDEFIQQYGTFVFDVLNDLGLAIGSRVVKKMVADIKARGVPMPPEASLFLRRDINYVTPTDPNGVLMHILPVKYTAATLPLDQEIPTLLENTTVRFVNYQGIIYLDGKTPIVASDIPLNGGTLFFVDDVLDVSTPDCTTCYQDVPLLEDLATITDASGFLALLKKNLVALTPPFTVIVPSDVFGFDKNPVYDYLTTNDTAAIEFIKNCTFPGFLYPTVAQTVDNKYNATSLSGIIYTFVYAGDPTSVSFITEDVRGSGTYMASPRKDAIFYFVTENLFRTYIPPPIPPEIAPITPTDNGVPAPPSSAYTLNLSYACLMLGLFVLFLIQ